MKVWVEWNDPVFVWGGTEDFDWDQAYRIVQDVVGGLGGSWDAPPWEHVKKKLPPELVEKFLDVVIKVNGLTYKYKKNIQEKPKISIDDIQKTLDTFNVNKVSVKAEIKKP